MPPTIPREGFGADLSDAICVCDVLIGQARTYLRPCDSELRFGVIEVGAAAAFIAALRPAVETTGPCPLRCIVRRSTRLHNPADGHASPDHHEVVIAAVTGDHRRTEGEGFRIVGHGPLKRQPLTRTYNRFAPLLRLYIDLASGIPIASQFGPKWLRVQLSEFPALCARPRLGISKPAEDNGMSAGEVKQYLVEHAKSHGVLSSRRNRARRVQTLLPALGPFRCQAVQGGGAEAAAWFIVPIEEHRRPAIRKANLPHFGMGSRLISLIVVILQ